MSSQRQIDANRANAAFSKGPVTPEGKARSSQNATRHGLAANTVVLRNENPEHFQKILDTYIQIFAPQDPFELDFVEEMAISKWRQYRAYAIESATYDTEMDRQAAELSTELARFDEPCRLARAFKVLNDDSHALSNLNRYEARYRRAFTRAQTELRQYRAEKVNFQSDPNPKTGHLSNVDDVENSPPL